MPVVTDDDIRNRIEQIVASWKQSRTVVVKWRMLGHDEQASIPMPEEVARHIQDELSEMGVSSKVVPV